MPMKRSTTVRESNIDLDATEGLNGETDSNIKLLLCSLCKNVLMDPRVCSSCGTACCKECVDDWETKDCKCPGGCQDFKFNKASKFLRNWLEKLKMKCKFQLQGCEETLKYQEVEEHQGLCAFRPWTCENVECGFESVFVQAKQHKNKCEF